jgi:1,4-dihydroxy-2-naphthoyl-CoA hydrolase
MDDFAEAFNQSRDGWCTSMGIRFVRVTLEEVVGELTVGGEHKQAYGIVHGGVYAGMIETLASVGAAMNAMQDGRSAVGLDNTTSFLHAVRGGTLRAIAKPLMRGKRTQVWEANVADESGRIVATGRVRLLCIEGDSRLAGRPVALEPK